MDKVTIETEATSAFRTLIRRNPYLSPLIDENDKTPIWDGSVFVYSKENTAMNKALLGRVPTQIKGHFTNDYFTEKIKFSIEKTYLNAFQSEGGAIFVVVYINGEYKSRIYYEQLLPIDIERLLINMEKQDSISVELREIPQDNLLLANLFVNFIKDRKKQMSTVDRKRLYFYDWENNKDIGTYLMHISSVSTPVFNPFQALSMSTIYIYGKPEGFNFEIPLERVNNAIIQTTNTHTIGCVDKVHYTGDVTTSIWTNGNLRIIFGKAMNIEIFFLKGNRIGGKFHYDIVGSLNNRLHDAEFALAVLRNKEFTINGVHLELNNYDSAVYERTSKYYKDMKLIRKKLNEIGVLQDFDIDKVDNEDKWKINLLMEINEDHEDVYLPKNHQAYLVEIANIQLTLIAFLRDGKLFVRDYFSEINDFIFTVNSEEGEEYNISRFLHLKDKAITSSNMRAEVVYLDIIKYDTWENYQISVNLFLLECIKAYDSGKGNHAELYQLSLIIAEWLISKDPNTSIYTLNYFQIIIRTRLLSSNELLLLRQLSTSDSETWDAKCGALILCGEYAQARKALNDQPTRIQDEFKAFPIFNILAKADSIGSRAELQ